MKTWGHLISPLGQFELDQKLPCADPPDCSGPATHRATWIYRADDAARPWGQSKMLCRDHAQEHANRLTLTPAGEGASTGGGV